MKPALVAVSFGTSYPETRKKTIEAVEKKLSQTYPSCDVFRAFTSNKVIKKIKEQEKTTILTVDQQMQQLIDKGYEEVYVQPLHIIPGSEYSKALHQAMRYKNDFKKLECELKFYKEKCIEQERQIQELKDINQWYESQFKSKRVF